MCMKALLWKGNQAIGKNSEKIDGNLVLNCPNLSIRGEKDFDMRNFECEHAKRAFWQFSLIFA